MKYFLLLTLLFFSCSNRSEQLRELSACGLQAEKALASTDENFMEETVVFIERVLKNYPKRISLYVNKATLEKRLGRYRDAVHTLDDLMEVKPDHVEMLTVKGVLHEILDEKKEAFACYEEALKITERRVSKITQGKIQELTHNIHKLIILKLLKSNYEDHYYYILTHPLIQQRPELQRQIEVIYSRSREEILNSYR